MIYIFNNNEELLHIFSEQDLIEFNYKTKINSFDEAIFELPIKFKDNFNSISYFGFFYNTDFKIMKITDLDIEDTIIVTGLDRAEYDLRTFKIINDKRFNGSDAQTVLSAIIEDTFFRIGNIEGINNLVKLNFYYITPLEALIKLIEACNCEFRIRYSFVNNRINTRYIDLFKKQGKFSGKQFYHGSDLLKISCKEDNDDVITALIGRGKGEEVGDGYGRRIQFTDVVWHTSNGNPVNKPAGQNYVALESAKLTNGIYFNNELKHRFGIYVDENITDPTILLEKTYEKLLELSKSKITYTADIVDIGSDVGLGDRVAIIRDDVNIVFQARVFEINYDKLNKDNSTVKLGDTISSVNPTLERANNNARSMVDENYQELSEFAKMWQAQLRETQRQLEERDREIDERMRVKTLEIDNKIVDVKTKATEQQNQLATEIRNKLNEVKIDITGFNNRLEATRNELKNLNKTTDNNIRQLVEGVRTNANSLIENARRDVDTAINGVRVSTENTINSIRNTVNNLDRKFDTNGELISLKNFKTTVEQTDRAINTKLTQLEEYKNADGTRQTNILSLAERKTTELLSREMTNVRDNFVSRNSLTETINGTKREIVESIQVGGRNLFLNSKEFPNSYLNSIHWTTDSNNYKGLVVKKRKEAWQGISQIFEVKTGEIYTFSSYVKSSIASDIVNFYVSHAHVVSPVANTTLNSQSIAINNEWKRVHFTFKILSDGKICPRFERFNQNGTLFVAGYKLEKGSIPTDWSPAPEDNETLITDKMATYRQEVDRNLTELRGIATNNTQLTNRLEQNLNSTKSTISSLFDNTGKLNELKAYKTERLQTDREIRDSVNTLSNNIFKKSEFRVTDDKIILATGHEIDNRKLASMISINPEAVSILSDKMIITANNENLVTTSKRTSFIINTRDNMLCDMEYNEVLKIGDEFHFEGNFTKIVTGGNLNLNAMIRIKYSDGSYSWTSTPLVENGIYNTKLYRKATLKISSLTTGKTPVSFIIILNESGWSNFTHYRVENLVVYKKKSAELLVDGSITADKLQINEVTAGLVNTSVFKALIGGFQVVEAETARIDNALVKNMSVQEILAKKIIASDIFTNRLNAIKVTAGMIDAETIKTKLSQTDYLSAYTGLIGGFRIGANPRYGGKWITGENQFSVGISSGASNGTALWVNWGTNWEQAGNRAWWVTTGGYMTCKAGATFNGRVDVYEYIDVHGNDILGNADRHGTKTKVIWWSQIDRVKSSVSDIKLKTNIKPASRSAINELSKMSIKEFDWKKNGKHEKFGAIAQEMEKIFPEKIVEHKNIKMINYVDFIPCLIKAIQELNDKIKRLENKYDK